MSSPVTARWPHCARPAGQAACVRAIQAKKQSADRAKRTQRKENGGAWGIPSRATTKPVLQIRTKTQGIALALIAAPAARRAAPRAAGLAGRGVARRNAS